MKNLLLYVVFTLFADALYAQATGKLVGKIIEEETNEAALFAPLRLLKNEEQIATTESDIDGYYEFSDVPAGRYELVCAHINCQAVHIKNIQIKSGRVFEYDVKCPKTIGAWEPVYIDLERPMVEVDTAFNPKILSADALQRTFQQDAGEATNNEGKRVSSDVFLDNPRVFGRKLSRKELRNARRAQKKEAKKK
jgi:hypothetical protein